MDIPISYYISLWMIALFVIILLLSALEIGFRIGLHKHSSEDSAVSESSKIVLSSLLLILGLILAFTFNASVHRYDARKAVVIEEANALGTLFYYANFLQEPERSKLRNTIYEYAKTRTQTDRNFSSLEEVQQLLDKSMALQHSIIDQTAYAINHDRMEMSETLILRAMSGVINAHTKRAGIVNDTLPFLVIFLQLFIATASIGFAGYMSGQTGKFSRWQIYALTFCFFCVIMTAQDFDRGIDGFIRTNSSAMDNIVERMSERNQL